MGAIKDLKIGVFMGPKRTFQEVVEKVLVQYPDLMMQDNGDAILILRKGGDDFEADDVVGNYSQTSYEKGDITQDDIAADCEEFLKENYH